MINLCSKYKYAHVQRKATKKEDAPEEGNCEEEKHDTKGENEKNISATNTRTRNIRNPWEDEKNDAKGEKEEKYWAEIAERRLGIPGILSLFGSDRNDFRR